MKVSIITALLGLSMTIFASTSANAGYLEKLKAIQEKIEVQFAPLLSEMQKAQVVEKLYNHLQETRFSEVYGTKKMVETIYILSPSDTNDIRRTEQNSYLRQNSLVATFDLASLVMFEQNIEREQIALNQIAQLNADLKQLYPNFSVVREEEIISKTTTTNVSHAILLAAWVKTLKNQLSPAQATTLEKIIFTDSPSEYKKANAAYVPNYYNSKQMNLMVAVGRGDQFEGSPLFINDAALNAMVNVVLHQGISSVETHLLDDSLINTALIDLQSFLTADVQAILKANKVSQIYFIERPENEQKLLEGGTLKLGPTKASMTEIFGILFR